MKNNIKKFTKKTIILVILLTILTPTKFIIQTSYAETNTRFNSEKIFPKWKDQTKNNEVRGVIGENSSGKETKATLSTGKTKLLLYFIPRITDILLKIAAAIIVVMMLHIGIKFVYAGDSDDQIEESKKFFTYALMGVMFIVLSYSFMKVIYYLLVP